MKKLAALILSLMTAQAMAVEPKMTDISCDDAAAMVAAGGREFSDEAVERLGELSGSCEGVADINGNLYLTTRMIVRSVGRDGVRLYLPANDHTFTVQPDEDSYVYMGGRKTAVKSLRRRDELNIYISIDEFTQDIPAPKGFDDIAFLDVNDEPVAAPVTPVAALPTTASSVPALALLGGLFAFGALVVRRIRRRAA